MTPSFTACHPAAASGDANANRGTGGAWAIDETPVSATGAETTITRLIRITRARGTPGSLPYVPPHLVQLYVWRSK
jgi:hypothetical protein